MTTTAIARPRLGPQRAVAVWTIAGAVIYIVSGLASILAMATIEELVLAPLGLGSAVGSPSLSIRNGIHAAAWGFIAAGMALPLGRWLGVEVAPSTRAWVILVAGLVLAAVTTSLVEEFVRARYGMFEPRATGWTIFAGPALIAIAVAGWAALAVPRTQRAVPALVTLAAAAGLAIVLLPSLPGAADGIDPESVPLAVIVGLDAVFASVTAVVVFVQGRSTASPA
jgi:hypothetical protein